MPTEQHSKARGDKVASEVSTPSMPIAQAAATRSSISSVHSFIDFCRLVDRATVPDELIEKVGEQLEGLESSQGYCLSAMRSDDSDKSWLPLFLEKGDFVRASYPIVDVLIDCDIADDLVVALAYGGLSHERIGLAWRWKLAYLTDDESDRLRDLEQFIKLVVINAVGAFVNHHADKRYRLIDFFECSVTAECCLVTDDQALKFIDNREKAWHEFEAADDSECVVLSPASRLRSDAAPNEGEGRDKELSVSDTQRGETIGELLSAVEERAAEAALEPELAKRAFDAVAFARHAHALGFAGTPPLREDINGWLRDHAGDELPDEQKPAIAEAINFFRDHWDAALVCLEKGDKTPCTLRAAVMNPGKGHGGMTFQVRSAGSPARNLSNRKALPTLELRK